MNKALKNSVELETKLDILVVQRERAASSGMGRATGSQQRGRSSRGDNLSRGNLSLGTAAMVIGKRYRASAWPAQCPRGQKLTLRVPSFLSGVDAKFYIGSVVLGLEAVNDIVHRDLKPETVFIATSVATPSLVVFVFS